MKSFVALFLFVLHCFGLFSQTWRASLAPALLNGPGEHAILITDAEGRIAKVETIDFPPTETYTVSLPANPGQQLYLTILHQWTDEKDIPHLHALTFANPPSRVGIDVPLGLPDWENTPAARTYLTTLNFSHLRRVEEIYINGVQQPRHVTIGGLKLQVDRQPGMDLFVALRANGEEEMRYYYLSAGAAIMPEIDYSSLPIGANVHRIQVHYAPLGNVHYHVLAINEDTEHPCLLFGKPVKSTGAALFLEPLLPGDVPFYRFGLEAKFYAQGIANIGPSMDYWHYSSYFDTLPADISLPSHLPRFTLQEFDHQGFSLTPEDTEDLLHACYRLDAGDGDTLSSWHIIGPAADLRNFRFPVLPRAALPEFSTLFHYSVRSARFELIRLTDRAHLDFWDMPSRFFDPLWLSEHGLLMAVKKRVPGDTRRRGGY